MMKLFSKNSNLCDHNSPKLQTDRQTDRQTTCDRNTALCTKVHRAVKTIMTYLLTYLLWSEPTFSEQSGWHLLYRPSNRPSVSDQTIPSSTPSRGLRSWTVKPTFVSRSHDRLLFWPVYRLTSRVHGRYSARDSKCVSYVGAKRHIIGVNERGEKETTTR